LKDLTIMKRYLSLAALSLATALTLSACGTDSGNTTSTDTTSTEAAAPASSAAAEASSSADASMSSSSDAVSKEHNQADAMFTRMMIPHHEQAVEMSNLMLSKADISPDIMDLATRIKDAQGPEIETMKSWLETWDDAMGPNSTESPDMGDMGNMNGGGEDTDEDNMGSGSGQMNGMEGMMSDDQMSELESAEGTEASRLFLESMTAHHEGAISMAQTEIDNGENTEVIELAKTIMTTQQAEIAEMKELLAGL
jgi:uncharacterized protein (DUF305 family)